MKPFDKYNLRVFLHLFTLMVALIAGAIGLIWVSYSYAKVGNACIVFELVVYGLTVGLVIAKISANYLTKPLKLLSQSIMHVSPDGGNVPAPVINNLTLGHELITILTTHIYALATTVQNVTASLRSAKTDFRSIPVADSLPLPLIIVGHDQNIVFANRAARAYLGAAEADIVNQNLYQVMDMSFESNDTFDNWLKDASVNSAIATKVWEHVKLSLANESKQVLQFDLAAYYNRAQSSDFEVLMVLFDHTERYSRDDEAMSFIALAVHELRTPLTLLRGYIEALEEDSASKLAPTSVEFLRRMDAAGQQLATFMNNVLNVARIEDDQFVIRMQEESWPAIIESAVSDMRLRAKIRGIEIETNIAPNLPPVGVDRVSIYEVISNLLDNGVKYSGKASKIVLSSVLNKEGFVETSVQDFGIGIPEGMVGNLFDKYYRNHRTRQEVSGTGLGLYLSKTIIEAHGGNIWVRSKEGQGSIFTFTVVPFDKINAQDRMADTTRVAHGWIKNHSLYRR
ncbi:MAG TPA: PAS domain-containing sensor histidine kinase [Patescibacteria group bacterium]|jgi:signal transduction histidine kinase|nr:PAS domain-containing sensor histidine kinase [Patescibacteria group bacterium]